MNDRRSLDTAYLWGLGGGQLSLSLVTERDGDLIGLSKVLDHAVGPLLLMQMRDLCLKQDLF